MWELPTPFPNFHLNSQQDSYQLNTVVVLLELQNTAENDLALDCIAYLSLLLFRQV